MNKQNRLIKVLALLVCFFVLLLFVQIGINVVKKLLYPKAYIQIVEKYANEYNIDENLIYAFIKTESGFKPKAQSDAGARGLMQITEETFDWIKTKIAPNEDLNFDDMFTPEQNIRFGSYFVSVCLLRYNGDLQTAAAAYHSGMGLVDSLVSNDDYSSNNQWLHTFPYSQMENYVFKISNNYAIYNELYNY